MDGIIIPIIVVAAIGLVAGIILTIASKVMAVSVDEQIEELMAAMPGANCGACGFPGCDNYAASLGEDESRSLSTSLCPVGGDKLSIELARILGIEATTSEPRVALISCKGSSSKIKRIMTHDKEWSCAAANQLYGGQMECSYGCLGHGDCVKACPYNAIKINEKLAEIDRSACIGCGICVSHCPKKVIQMSPQNNLVFIGCASHAKGGETRKACQVGCIGCKKCEKECPEGAIVVENNLAKIDYELCVNCKTCATICPTKAIVRLIKVPAKPKKRFNFFKSKIDSEAN